MAFLYASRKWGFSLEKEKKPFAVPSKHSDMRRVYAYLTSERMIDREVIRAFESKGLIFEDAEHHNAVFVGVDANGEPKHIQKRSTNSGSSFKGNVDSSNADYSFNYVGTSDKLFVFEAPIATKKAPRDSKSYLSVVGFLCVCLISERVIVRKSEIKKMIPVAIRHIRHVSCSEGNNRMLFLLKLGSVA